MYLRSINCEKPRGTFWENVCGRKHTDHTVTTNVLKDVKKKISIMVPVDILLNWIKWSGLVQTSKEFIFSPGKDLG